MSPIVIMAASDAEFDGRRLLAMGRHERRRYVERAIASLSALHVAGLVYDVNLVAELVRCKLPEHVGSLINGD